MRAARLRVAGSGLAALALGTLGTLGTLGPLPAAAAAGPVPTSLTVSITPSHVGYPAPATVSGRFVDTSTGAGLGGNVLNLYLRWTGHPAWFLQKQLATGSTGWVSYRFTPSRQTWARLTYGGNASAAPADSLAAAPAPTVTVARQLTLTAPPATLVGATTYLTGTERPILAGLTGALYGYSAGAWHGLHLVTFDSTGSVRFPVRFGSAGPRSFRLSVGAAGGDTATTSRPVTITAYPRVGQPLAPGASGPAVLRLQQWLTALHYDLAPPDGTYGDDTMHAVTAFQKVNDLARTGAVDTATLVGLNAPVTPRLRDPLPGPAIEVDLAHQVVLYAVNGVLTHIFDSSTGGGYTYYVNGVASRAITPTGHFTIQRKVNAWVTSPLGVLWRPAYFVGGYAIHGEPAVPPYPASHGCVRITMNAMNRSYPIFAIGVPVSIY